MSFFWGTRFTPMSARRRKVAVLALVAKCRVVRLLITISRMAVCGELSLVLPKPAHIVVIRIVGFITKLLPITNFLFGCQRCIKLIRVIYYTAFSEAKEAPYRLLAVLEERVLGEA